MALLHIHNQCGSCYVIIADTAVEEDTKTPENPSNPLEDDEDTGIVLVSYVPKTEVVESSEINDKDSPNMQSAPVKEELMEEKEPAEPVIVEPTSTIERVIENVKLDINDNEHETASNQEMTDDQEQQSDVGEDSPAADSSDSEPSGDEGSFDVEETSPVAVVEDPPEPIYEEIAPEEEVAQQEEPVQQSSSDTKEDSSLTSLDDLPPPPGAFYEVRTKSTDFNVLLMSVSLRKRYIPDLY